MPYATYSSSRQAFTKHNPFTLFKTIDMTPEQLQGDVCRECGISANVLTCLRRYHAAPRKLAFEGGSTFHEGKCAACGERKWITEQRDFYYPDFSLLRRAKLGMALKNA